MEAAEKEIYRFLKRHAPSTLKKIINALKYEPLTVFYGLLSLYEKGLIEREDFSVTGNLDPDFCRKYKVKADK